ncbi:ABC transporter substrate-binding protein [Actinomadura sp. NPDC048955]|uniref:ABC transporter substrate-binding protein n=1 Tax=Actinomadura sp. NPDC048955 TaxID=3158228 RepID=UPI0033C8332A
MRSIFHKVLILCLSGTLVAACTGEQPGSGKAGSPASGTLKTAVNSQAAALVPGDVKAKGTIVVASASTNAPMEFLAPDGKTLVGFDIDLSDAIAGTLGLKAEHTASTFDAIIPALQAKRFNLGMSGFFITPARQKVVDFVPYLRDGSALVVKAGNPLKLSMDNLMSLCGHRLAGEKGSVQGIEYLPAISKDCTASGRPAITVMMFPELDDAHLALTGGRADAIMEDSVPSGYRAAKSNGRYEVAPGATYKPVSTGIALPKGAPLKPAVEAAVNVLASDGTLKRLMAKWSIPDTALLPRTTGS